MTSIRQSRTLIIFPGAGNPSHQTYAKVYDLIERGALEAGYSSVDSSIRWPGQQEGESDAKSLLEFSSSVATAKNHLGVYEREDKPYDILARSFGTYVALTTAASLRPAFLSHLILWGVPPYWRMWELYVRDLSATREVGKSKGVFIGDGLFSRLEPIESLLGTTVYPVTIASGINDRFSTPADISYFRSLTTAENVRFSQPVKGAPHEMSEDFPATIIADYFKSLFD